MSRRKFRTATAAEQNRQWMRLSNFNKEGTEVRGRPYVWEMVKEAIRDLDGEATYSEIRRHITNNYSDVNDSTITCQIIMCTVNHPSRIHYPQSAHPRIANTKYDFLFRTGRGAVEIYDRVRHAEWEVRRRVDGSVVVALVGGPEFPPGPRLNVPGPRGEKQSWTIPGREEFLRGIEEYERREQREAVYKVAAFVVSRFWGEHAVVADAVAALLVSWNRAFYRFGLFDIAELERCIADNARSIEKLRERNISSLADHDEDRVRRLFGEFLEALQIAAGSSQGRKSPVSAAKALHLMAPSFFPIWDRRIAPAYGCQYSTDAAGAYWAFCRVTRGLAERTRVYTTRGDKTLVKLIDQYNYSRFTRGWI